MMRLHGKEGRKMVDLRTKLSSLELDNPLIPASGCYGFGQDFAPLYDLNLLGSISFKGTTVEPREGNALPRIAECPMGMLNSVGLQNPGVKVVVEEELPALKKIFHKPLVANISGFSFEEFSILAEEMDKVENVGLLEVNISCPNVHNGGMAFGTDAKNVAEVCKRVKEKTKKPVYMKLSPNVTDITEMAKAAEAAGADGISLINTLLGMRIDIKRRRPVLANKVGGYSGPGVFPIALRMVYQVRKAVQIPIIGMGGIASAEDVIEMMMAGASAVEIGAENLVHPYICRDILENLPILCEELGISSLQEIIGIID
jgi:dihydroorotate oxidase